MQLNKFRKNFQIISKFAIIDMRRRFKSSILSWFWLIFSPLLLLFMYWFAFATAGNNTNNIEYTVGENIYNFKWIAWTIIGAFSWSYCGDVIVSGPRSTRDYHWMSKSFGIKPWVPPIFVNLSKFMVGAALMIVAWIIAIICNATDGDPVTKPVSLYSLEVPLIMLLIFIFMISYSYALAPINGISKDFQNLLLVLPMLLSWVSGVFIQPSITNGNHVTNVILQINPFYFMINGLRSTMLGYGEIFTPNDYNQWYSILSFFIVLMSLWLFGFLANWKSRKFIVDII